jgi:hypothetical protein
MRRTTTLMTTALLALSLAPALQAQGYHQDDRRPEDQRQDGQRPDDRRQDDRYQNDDRYPDAAHLDRVSELAHGIDETATYIRRQFERNNRRPNRDEARVMEQLRALNEQAARFHDDVESSRQNPRHTAREFAALENAFNDAARSLRRTGSRSYVNRGMVRIYTQMNELSGYYGRRAGYYGTWDHPRYDQGHDRYDRGHDNHDGDDHDRDHGHDNGYRPPYNF